VYTDKDYKTKKQLKEDFKSGIKIRVHQPNADVTGFPFRPSNCSTTIEGPHYPKPHKWYASVSVDSDGYIEKIKG